MLRDTCMYCEQEGKVTQLVRVSNHWGCCPVHSASFLDNLRYPTVVEVLARQGMAPSLQDKGRPTRNGVIA